MSGGRIEQRFAELKSAGRAGLVAYVTAGDPNPDTALKVMQALPASGADLIELGMPFSDPMADGPTIQEANLRALASGASMRTTLEQVRKFRQGDAATPVVLMGYYNPIYVYGVDAFLKDAVAAGIDGLIIVDLPPEADEELCLPAMDAGINFIRLATPTTDEERLPAVLANTSGFVYYVAIAGITGAAAPDSAKVAQAIARLKRHTDLPIVVGFGIKTAADAEAVAAVADGAAVGTALVAKVGGGANEAESVAGVSALVADLAAGVARAGKEAP